MVTGQRLGYPGGVATTHAGRDAWRTMLDLVLDGEAHDRIPTVAAAVGLSPGLLKTLFHLAPGDGVRMGDLADHWGCDASYVTTLADGLQARGLVRRRPHPHDRRVKTIALTAKGAALKTRVLDALYEPPRALEALSAAEQRRLHDLLRKVAAADEELARNQALVQGTDPDATSVERLQA